MKKSHMILSLALLSLPLQACDLLDSINYADDKKAYYDSLQSQEQSTDSLSADMGNLFNEDDSEANSNQTQNNEKKSNLVTFKAEWVGTSDGDTIKIKSKERGSETIRLLLVDTPELGNIGKENQLYALNASRFTKALMKENQYINVEVGEVEYDSYNRLLAYVYLEDGTMLNEILVRNGYARVGYIINDTKYLERLQTAQNNAKSEKLRIWSVSGYVTDDGYNMDVVTDRDIMNSVGK